MEKERKRRRLRMIEGWMKKTRTLRMIEGSIKKEKKIKNERRMEKEREED